MRRIALLESGKQIERTAGGSTASVVLHVAVLAFAIGVTSHAGIKREDPVFVALPRWRPEVRMISQRTTKRAASLAPRVPLVSVAVPTAIPVNIPGPAISVTAPTAEGAPSIPSSGSPTGNDTAASVSRGDAPFDVEEVDVAASVLSGQRGPAYPEALRAMGVDGRVVARFIIGRNGRVENDPTIVSATDDQFASAVRRYLAGARYRAATKNGEPVRQLAEQEFVFSVRR